MRVKTVLVTGGSGAIGSAVAEKFYKNGYNVAIQYFKGEERARALLGKLNACCKDGMPLAGNTAEIFRADIRSSEEVAELFSKVRSKLGEVDILVNNAGIGKQILFTDITDELWRDMFSVNVDGCFYCCREAIPHMIREKNGRIINISSVWGITGASCEAHYSAAKAALIGLTKALAKELGPSQITVNCVAPGVIDTEMNAHLSAEVMESLAEETPLCRIGTPEEIANPVYFLASDEASFITGQVLSPNGGFVI